MFPVALLWKNSSIPHPLDRLNYSAADDHDDASLLYYTVIFLNTGHSRSLTVTRKRPLREVSLYLHVSCIYILLI